MGFDALVRKGVSLANSLTSSLQDTITLQQWTGQSDGYGTYKYAAAASYTAIVEYKQRVVRDAAGNEVQSPAKVTIIQPVTGFVAGVPAFGDGAFGDDEDSGVGRREPVDPRDRIVLPDGEWYPIARVDGLGDPDTNAPYMLEIYLGAA